MANIFKVGVLAAALVLASFGAGHAQNGADSGLSASFELAQIATEFRLVQLGDAEGGEGQDEGGAANLPVKPKEAASIAKSLVPGAKVLKVKLLPGDTYAVTLRGDGKLTRIMVDGHTGAAN